ncbi:hypothetical protein PG988_001950 [Apiospora saccharicola]
MVSMLEKLPWEVADLIRQQLDTGSILHLRLASKACKAKLANSFSRLFAHQIVPLTPAGLARFDKIVSRPETRCGLRTLTFVCLYYQKKLEGPGWGNTSSIQSQPDDRAALPWPKAPGLGSLVVESIDELVVLDGTAVHQKLTDALKRLSGMELEAISLEARVVVGKSRRCVGPEDVDHLDWRLLWARAVQAYRILMSAMARSQVHVRKLGLYRDTMKCSIPTNEFVAPLSHFQTEGFSKVAENIKSFSLSLATKLLPMRFHRGGFYSWPDDYFTPEEIPCSERDTRTRLEDVAGFIRGMPQLESLDLHWFRPSGFFKADATPTTERLLRRVMCKGGFPNLRILRLQGLPLSKATLQQCISQHPQLQRLKLRNVFLTDVDMIWDETLMKILAGGRSITNIELSHLWQRMGPVWDAAPGCIPGEEYPVRYGFTLWQVGGGGSERALSSYKAEDRGEPRTIEVMYEPGIQNKVLGWRGDYGKGHKFREENGPLGAYS